MPPRWSAHPRPARKLMGFGHRVYRAEDPRAGVARDGQAPRRTALRRVAAALEQAALAELRERRPDRAIETNVEFWAAVILDFAECPGDDAGDVHLRAHRRVVGASWSRSGWAGWSAGRGVRRAVAASRGLSAGVGRDQPPESCGSTANRRNRP